MRPYDLHCFPYPPLYLLAGIPGRHRGPAPRPGGESQSEILKRPGIWG